MWFCGTMLCEVSRGVVMGVVCCFVEYAVCYCYEEIPR